MAIPNTPVKKAKLPEADLMALSEMTGYSTSMITMVFYGHRKNDLISQAIASYTELKEKHSARFAEQVKELTDLFKSLRQDQIYA